MGVLDFLGDLGTGAFGGPQNAAMGLVGNQMGVNPMGVLGKLLGLPDLIPANRQATTPPTPAAVTGTPGFNGEAMQQPSSAPMTREAATIAMTPQQAPAQPKKSGGFRDFLGYLGDVMLAGNGMPAMYGPRKEREEMTAALSQYLGADSLLNPVIRYKPELAIEAQKAKQDYLGGELDRSNDVREAAYQHLGGAQDQASYDRARAVLANLFGRYGLNPADLGLPDTFSPEAIAELRNRGAEPRYQLAEQRHNRRLDWDIDDDEIDNERMSRNTDSLIGTREQRLEEYRRTNQRRDATTRRGQDMTDSRSRRGQDIRGNASGKGSPREKIVSVASPAEAQALKPGTLYRGPDGVVRKR